MRIVFFIGTVDFLLSLISYIYYRQNFAWGRTWGFGIFYLLLALHTPISVILPAGTPHFIMKLSAWLEGLWIAFAFYSLLLAALHLVAWIISKLGGFALPSHKIAAAGLVFICCFIAWGSWRAFHPIVRTEKITAAKLASGTHYKIVLLTDIHLGRILGRSYAEDLVQRVNAIQPDLILIAGDVIDEKIFYVEQEDSLSALSKLQASRGSYISFGNHEYLDDPDRWQQMLESQGFTVLRDADTVVDGVLKITGLNDFSHSRSALKLEQLAAHNSAYYNILLDHQPRKMHEAAAAGYDLYLAGHTHTGQLFPNRYVTRRMYELDYGRKDFGSLTAVTSAGYGFWGPPVRTEAAPEIVVIELQGQ